MGTLPTRERQDLQLLPIQLRSVRLPPWMSCSLDLVEGALIPLALRSAPDATVLISITPIVHATLNTCVAESRRGRLGMMRLEFCKLLP